MGFELKVFCSDFLIGRAEVANERQLTSARNQLVECVMAMASELPSEVLAGIFEIAAFPLGQKAWELRLVSRSVQSW